MLAWLNSGERCLPDLWMTASWLCAYMVFLLCMYTGRGRERKRDLPLLIMPPILWDKDATLVTSLNLQFSSVAQSCLTLRNPMNHSTPGLPVYNQLPEFTQTPIHWVHDAIHHFILCCPLLLLPSIPPSISLFQWVSSLHKVAKVLEFQL